MIAEFKSKKLRDLSETEKGAQKYPAPVVDRFIRAIDKIHAVNNMVELSTSKALNCQKVQGAPDGQFSLQLDKQYFLIIELHKDHENEDYIVIIEIVANH